MENYQEVYKLMREHIKKDPTITQKKLGQILKTELIPAFVMKYNNCQKIIGIVRQNKSITFQELSDVMFIELVTLKAMLAFMERDNEFFTENEDIYDELKTLCLAGKRHNNITRKRIEIILELLKKVNKADIAVMHKDIGVSEERYKSWLRAACKEEPLLLKYKRVSEFVKEKSEQPISYFEAIKDELSEFILRYPNIETKDVAKHFDVTEIEMSSYLRTLEVNSVFLPTKFKKQIEKDKFKDKIIQIKEKNPFITVKEISVMLEAPKLKVTNAIHEICTEWKEQRADSFEIYLKYVLKELKNIKDESWKRFRATERPSSRWLEINIMAVDREMKLLGLGNTSKIEISSIEQKVSKQERDAVMEAWEKSKMKNITPKGYL